MKKLKIIVSGFIGLYPTGGVTWDYIQYPLGLKMQGHDVYYIEDTGQYSNYRISKRAWDDPYDSVNYLRQIMEKFGLKDAWAYRDTFGKNCYGMSLKKIMEVCSSADIFINISDSSICRQEYLQIKNRVLIDTDPMFTQLQTNEALQQDPRYPVNKFNINEYTHHFSFGENITEADCKIPSLGLIWRPTRQPICLNYWIDSALPIKTGSASFTTIMNWSTRSKLNYLNQEWGQKDVEFNKFISIPKNIKNVEFKIVLAASAKFKNDVDTLLINNYGWKILDPLNKVKTTSDYKNFIRLSDAEFSVAKETYVKSNSGWFSCRSACYLAMGKPVVTQETQWSKYIPSGNGLFAFTDIESAIDAIKKVNSNLNYHSIKAKEIAYEYFDSNKVLHELLEKIN